MLVLLKVISVIKFLEVKRNGKVYRAMGCFGGPRS